MDDVDERLAHLGKQIEGQITSLRGEVAGLRQTLEDSRSRPSKQWSRFQTVIPLISSSW
jgi:hypothetical protein